MSADHQHEVFQVGELLNNTYRIEAILGRGGTSDVYLARNEISGRASALKVLKAEFARNEDYLILLKREEEMRDIRHDAVVRYSENQRTPEGHVYLVMDYVDGPSLQALQRKGGVPAEDVLVVCRRVAEGLRAAHARNIVHRDLSPDNIILRNGDPADAVIIDFGIAKDANPGAATIVGNEFAGKFAYAAPEQLGGNTDARSDIYSLGATLLATFRGKSPDVGSNLMDVVRIKNDPLDTEGVPEPLKSVLDRMTHPDPSARYQTAQSLLDDFLPTPIQQSAATQEPLPDSERTVVRPKPENKPAVAKPERSGGGRPVMLIGLVVAIVAAGAAAFFLGVFGPKYPEATPFVLFAGRSTDGVLMIEGNVPSPAVQEGLEAMASAAGGDSSLTLASGDISPDWSTGVLSVVETASQLNQFSLDVSDNSIALSGTTSDPALQERIEALALPGGLPDGMDITQQIIFLPPTLAEEALLPVLASAANCGSLELANLPAGGYGPNDNVQVTGQMANNADRVALFDALSSVAGGREIQIETDVLNPSLCEVIQNLPVLPSGGFDITFAFGATGQPNPGGRFLVGENPVIDVEIPQQVKTGFVYVSIIDVTGSAFHLLPNVNRKTNEVAKLRDGEDGPLKLRVAYPVSEANGPDKLAFMVDDSVLGKSMVLVLHSKAPLFDELRPTSESAAGYATSLERMQSSGNGKIGSLDSRLLTSLKP